MKILVFGATGSAGGSVFKACLAAPSVREVRTITRRRMDVAHPKLRSFVHADFTSFDAIPEAFAGIDACFFCLGVSSLQVRDETKYRTITVDYAVAAAEAMRRGSPSARFHFISGANTRADGKQMWARVKAEAEGELMTRVQAVCWRPGFIDGEVSTSGPWSGALVRRLFRLLRPWKSLYISGGDLGRAMLQATREQLASRVIENRDMHEIAARWTG